MTLRVGFIGYRFMGEAHANALDRLPMFFPDVPEIERRVLIGRDERALAAAADRLGFSTTATDWSESLDEIDVLYTLTPNHLHAEPAIDALSNDVHVLCEKPLAHTLEAAERMEAAAGASDARSAVAFNYRFVPAIRYAKNLIESGAIGEVRQFRGRYLQDWLAEETASWEWRLDAELAGSGALGDLGSHTVDLARFLVGDIDRTSGNLRTFVSERSLEDESETRPVTVDDAYTAQIEFENGAIGVIEASRVTHGHKNDCTIEVHGTDGSLRFSLERLNELYVLREGNRGYEAVLVTDESDPYIDVWWPPGHVLGWEHTFVHENYEFLRAIDGGTEFEPSFDDGVYVQRVLDAIERSAKSDRWVSVG